METIKTYIENLFASLPKTEQVSGIKRDMLEQMEEKYNQLKSEGRSENEAVGQVISEFGSIDELTEELGIRPAAAAEETLPVSGELAEEYLEVSKKNALFCSVGVGLCIFAPAVMMAVNAFDPPAAWIALLPLFALIAAAVALFIVMGVRTEKYKTLEQKTVVLDSITEERVRARQSAFTPAFAAMIASGVALCILAPIVLILLNEYLVGQMSVAVMLAIIAAAVAAFVYAGVRHNSCQVLLNTSDEKVRMREMGNSKAAKVFAALEGLIWPLTVVAFLVWGFRFDGWEICWVLFPAVGILCGVVRGIIKALSGK